MRKWQIRPLQVGTLQRRRSDFLHMDKTREPLDVPVTMFLVESGDSRVLVDTGGDDPATAHPSHHPLERTPEQHPLAALKAVGVDPQSIPVVVNTHLHWDHCCGNSLFSHAKFFVQRRELQYAAAPLPWHMNSYDSFLIGLTPPWASTQFQLLEGDAELAEGLRLLLMPGHTPGMQSVLVEAESGQYLLASDNVPLYENWEGRGHIPHIPNNNHYSFPEYHKTLLRMDSLGARVIPSHDSRVFDRSVYR